MDPENKSTLIILAFSIIIGYIIGYGYTSVHIPTSDLTWGWLLWGTFVTISIANFYLLCWVWKSLKPDRTNMRIARYQLNMKLYGGIFIIISFLRSIFPNISYTHICFFDVYLCNSITAFFYTGIMKMCYIIQICTALTHITADLRRYCVNISHKNMVLVNYLSNFLIFGAFIAHLFSCYAVITMCQFWYVVEKCIEIVCLTLLVLCCSFLYYNFQKLSDSEQQWKVNIFFRSIIFLGIAHLPFMGLEEVSQYLTDYNKNKFSGDEYLDFYDGFMAATTCNEVTQVYSIWIENVPTSLAYFTVFAWTSVWLTLAPKLEMEQTKKKNKKNSK